MSRSKRVPLRCVARRVAPFGRDASCFLAVCTLPQSCLKNIFLPSAGGYLIYTSIVFSVPHRCFCTNRPLQYTFTTGIPSKYRHRRHTVSSHHCPNLPYLAPVRSPAAPSSLSRLAHLRRHRHRASSPRKIVRYSRRCRRPPVLPSIHRTIPVKRLSTPAASLICRVALTSQPAIHGRPPDTNVDSISARSKFSFVGSLTIQEIPSKARPLLHSSAANYYEFQK